MHISLWIALGALTGWMTGRLVKGNQYGPWADIVMGIAGALGAGFLIHYGGFPGRVEFVSTTISAILGAVVLTVVVSFVSGRKRYA